MSNAWCKRILEALIAAGVEDLVVSPGSRSTPLLLAALHSPLRLHSVIDERSAAFFALGRARARGSKVALLCTSGSAGAHYLPAFLEARYSGHVLIALTADRPPELKECGSNQTIAQEALLAAACPPVLDLGLPQSSEAHALAARRRVYQAVSLADGPLHINLPFRKPLEPEATDLDRPLESRPLSPMHPAPCFASASAIASALQACQNAERGLIIAGPCGFDGSILNALARASGFVLLAESTSGARLDGERRAHRCDAFPHILGNAEQAAALAPDLILQFGQEPSCSSLNRWLGTQLGARLRFVSRLPSNDAVGTAELIVGEPRMSCERLIAALPGRELGAYAQAWQTAEERCWPAVARSMEDSKALSEAQATAAILAGLAPRTQLTLGNSLPIRAADQVLPGSTTALRVLHQRGTSGIDGLIAGAIGSCDTGPSALVLGDVSAVHDLSSLALAPHASGPLSIFVLDNGGGQIFSHLPVAAMPLSDAQYQLWQTPPAVELGAICRGYGVAFKEVDTHAALGEAIAWSQSQRLCLIRVAVQPNSMREFLREVQREL